MNGASRAVHDGRPRETLLRRVLQGWAGLPDVPMLAVGHGEHQDRLDAQRLCTTAKMICSNAPNFC